MARAEALPSFTPMEVGVAVAAASFIQAFFFILLIAAGKPRVEIKAKEELLPRELPMAVKPVLDDAPLLKLGGKKVKPKLPDMWKKLDPTPVQRFEEKSAPSEKAKDDPQAAPTSSVAIGDAAAPPPDAELAKEVDPTLQELDAAVADKDPEVEGPGAKDGVKEGTETDPLKARAVDQYRMKIAGWFSSRFKAPVGQVPCEELQKLSAAVNASVSPDGTVTGYSISRPSGNAAFDAKVKATMDGVIGQQVPPPPPLYPGILGSTVYPTFSGKGAKCEQPPAP
ncbi:MAG: TonB C-terminal domain-containing protein [Polyangiaceae bacterium]|nr:TonB C-terminal domain-containing protein [Polyangiaceae bacterium]MCE7889897.1 energy transducer TonB [Sorangiineae bacterium PRO1]MCL4751191.1 energy transducer TonB [Myxococcales bacterium]